MKRLSPEIQHLLQDLRSGSKEPHERWAAAEKLGAANVIDERVVEALKSAARSDSNQHVRVAAGRALRNLGVAARKEQSSPTLTVVAPAPAPTPDLPLIPVEAVTNSGRKQGGCLTAFLALALVANSMLGVFSLAMAGSPLLRTVAALLLFSGLVNFACAGFTIAIYKWKRWGVYGYLAGIVVISLMNLGLGDIGAAARAFIPIAILISLVRPIWNQME